MHLSYSWRLICLALCSVGLLQGPLECLGWLMAPFLLRVAMTSHARHGERALFLLALVARLGPWLVVLATWLPAYIRTEENLSGERVGAFCLTVAATVAAIAVFLFVRVVRASTGVKAACAQCREAGRSPHGLPILLQPGKRPLLAVVGLFRSRILLAESLLLSGRFSALTLNIALLHEDAHAQQRDNLKMLFLSLLPHIPFATPKRASLGRHWRLAAEIAADRESTMGRSEPSLLLAELLLTMARDSNHSLQNGAFGLLSSARDLGVRVESLLHQARLQSSGFQPKHTRYLTLRLTLALGVSMASLAILCALCNHFGHHAAEMLLHIG